jgi:multisubunit Na+/H+ antiporter MnhG subunit
MKKSVLGVLFFIASIGLVKAADLSELLSELDESMVVYFSVFILAFVLIFFALNKFFKEQNRSFAGIIAAVLSFLIVWGINKSGFDLEGIFLDLGIPQETLTTIVTLIVLAGIVFIIIKMGKNSLFVLGGLFIVASLFVYAKAILIIIGVVLLFIRVILFGRGRGKSSSPSISHS